MTPRPVRRPSEAAPILFAGATFFKFVADDGWKKIFPYGPGEPFMAMSMHLHVIASQGSQMPDVMKFGCAAVLIGLILSVNSLAIVLRCFNRINERYGDVTTTGEIRLLNKNIYDPDISLLELRKSVGMAFQRPNPMPISVFENIVFGLRLHRDPRSLKRSFLNETVEKALREVLLWDDLKDRLDTQATTLQLEQQQKLCIARLLPLKPRIILMDEPCSALDVEGTTAIEERMRALRGRFTIVIVTHNMMQARRASDESIFMLMGELVEHSRTEHMFLTPSSPKTAEYIEGRYG